MRLLLGVECIQSQVANILLEKLPEYMDDSGNVEYVHLSLAPKASPGYYRSLGRSGDEVR